MDTSHACHSEQDKHKKLAIMKKVPDRCDTPDIRTWNRLWGSPCQGASVCSRPDTYEHGAVRVVCSWHIAHWWSSGGRLTLVALFRTTTLTLYGFREQWMASHSLVLLRTVLPGPSVTIGHSRCVTGAMSLVCQTSDYLWPFHTPPYRVVHLAQSHSFPTSR